MTDIKWMEQPNCNPVTFRLGKLACYCNIPDKSCYHRLFFELTYIVVLMYRNLGCFQEQWLDEITIASYTIQCICLLEGRNFFFYHDEQMHKFFTFTKIVVTNYLLIPFQENSVNRKMFSIMKSRINKFITVQLILAKSTTELIYTRSRSCKTIGKLQML